MTANRIGYGEKPGVLTACRVTSPVAVDGYLTGRDWANAPRTAPFVDMLTGAPAPLATTASILWDDDNLYIGFWAEEPQLIATMTERDQLLFFENDLEVFIDGGDSYYELEVNAIGNIYEVFYIWRDAYSRGSKWDVPRFDVHSPRVHSFAGDHPSTPEAFWPGRHPRGTRWAFLDYDLPGLRVAVATDGVVNDASVRDKGWTLEIAIPWESLEDLANGRSLPPADGDVWGIFLGRFEQLAGREPGSSVTAGWAAGKFGIADTHIPESFTQVTFSRAAPGAQ